MDPFPIKDNFPDEHLMHLHSLLATLWFVDIVNFIVVYVIPPHAFRSQR